MKKDSPIIKVTHGSHQSIQFTITKLDLNAKMMKKLICTDSIHKGTIFSQFHSVQNLELFLQDHRNYEFVQEQQLLKLKWKMLWADGRSIECVYDLFMKEDQLSEDKRKQEEREMLYQQLRAFKNSFEEWDRCAKESLLPVSSKTSKQSSQKINNSISVVDEGIQLSDSQAYDNKQDEQQRAKVSQQAAKKKVKKTKTIKKQVRKNKQPQIEQIVIKEEPDCSLPSLSSEPFPQKSLTLRDEYFFRQRNALKQAQEKFAQVNQAIGQKFSLLKWIHGEFEKELKKNPQLSKGKCFNSIKNQKRSQLTRLGIHLHLRASKTKIFIGELKNGTQHGLGIISSATNFFIGEWKYSKACGRGQFTSIITGDKFIGNYADDKKEGYGMDIFSNGDRFQGFFASDQKKGYGVYTYECGVHFEGEWSHNFANGPGIEYYGDGSTFEGTWLDDKKHGEGVFTNPSGKSRKQVWKHELLQKEEGLDSEQEQENENEGQGVIQMHKSTN